MSNPTPAAPPVARALHAARVATAQIETLRAWRAVPPDYVEITLDGSLPPLPPRQPPFLEHLPLRRAPSLKDPLAALAAVARDPRVTGAVLHLRGLAAAPATRDALVAAIAAARGAGKRVVAYASTLDAATYPVACACDEVLLQPGGGIGALGIRRGFAFLADSLGRIGLTFEAVRVSPYKSATDLLTDTALSPEARQMVDWLMDDAFDALVDAVADGRGLARDAALARIDGSPFTDVEAVANGLADAIVSAEDLPAHLGPAGAPATVGRWKSAQHSLLPEPPEAPGKRVALIRIEGLIVDGESRPLPPRGIPVVGESRSGDVTVVAEARRALADDDVAATVVWIDSPGGSSTASEAIAAALEKLAERKPLVAVMGPVAGSGGYYVATPAHHIMAQPSTLTGSIGVIAGKFVTTGLLERLAVRRQLVMRGANMAIWDGQSGFTPAHRERVEAMIARVYDVFVARVAKGRGMAEDEVRALGGGRVWTGRQALGYGLIDALGDLEAGAAEARRRAGISARAPLVAAHAGRKPLGPQAAATAAAGAARAAVAALVPATAAIEAVLDAADDAALLGRGGVWLLSPVGAGG